MFSGKIDPRLLSSLMALCCMSLVCTVGYHFTHETAYPFLVASMGAASVIMFCAPNSPMATPRAFLMGNTLSAMVGVTIGHLTLLGIPVPVLAPITVACAIGAMHIMRCQHPPGGATALVAVIGGSQISELGYLYALFPVAMNVSSFYVFVFFQRRIVAKLQQEDWSKHSLKALSQPEEAPTAKLATVAEVHQRFGLSLEIKSEDLEKVYSYLRTQERLGTRIFDTLGSLASAEVPAIEYGASLKQAWELMNKHNTKALVVVDKFQRVDGQITLPQIISALNLPEDQRDPKQVAQRLQGTDPEVRADFPESVGHLREPISTEPASKPLSVALETGATYPIAVVDEKRKFRGLVYS